MATNDNTQRYNIAVGDAIKNLRNLTQEIAKYDRKVLENITTGDKLNRKSKETITSLNELDAQVGRNEVSMSQLQSSTSQTNASMQTLRASAKSAATDIGSLGKSAQTAAGNFSKLSTDTDKLRTSFSELRLQADQLKTANAALATSQRNLGTSANLLKTNLDNIGTAARPLRTLFADMANTAIQVNSNFRAIRNTTQGMATQFASVQVTARAASSALISASRSATTLQANLRAASVAVNQNSVAVRNDTLEVRNSTIALRAFNSALGVVTNKMLLKNQTIAAQTQALRNDSRETVRLTINLQTMGRLILTQLVSRVFSAFIGSLRDSVETAQRLSLAIAELQGITLSVSDGILKTAKSTSEWTNELLALSTSFGIPVLEVAEALYAGLSNQVIKTGDATAFLAQESKLAIATHSTLNQAVETTSTVINAYGKSVNDTAEINAALFRAVDIGRFRLNELGSSFARAAVLSKTLGVSYQEQLGSLAELTRQGLDADTANTLLANVYNSLIKPTKEMTALLAQWGFNSGDAAIGTLGFVEVLSRLEQEAQKGDGVLTELAKQFEDIRALTGAAALTGNFNQWNDAIRRVSNSGEELNAAFAIAFNSSGKQMEIQVAKLQKEFVQFGNGILSVLIDIGKFFGGADNALQGLIKAITIGSIAWLSYGRALTTANLLGGAFELTMQRTVARLVGVQAAAGAAGFAIRGLQAAFAFGIPLIIGYLAEFVITSRRTASDVRADLIKIDEQLTQVFTPAIEKWNKRVTEAFKSTEEGFKNLVKDYGTAISGLRAANNALAQDFEKTFAAIKKSILDTTRNGLETLKEEIKQISKDAEAASKRVEDAKKRLIDRQVSAADNAFENQLNGKGPLEQARLIAERRKQLEGDVQKLRAKNEIDLALMQEKRVDDLFEQEKKILEKLREDSEKEITDPNGVKRKITVQGKGVKIEETAPDGTKRTRTIGKPKGGARISVPINDPKIAADAIAAEAAAARLVTLANERAAIDAKRIADERKLIADQEAAAAKLVKAEQAKQAAFDRLLAAQEKLDAFTIKGGNPFEAQELAKEINTAAQAAGLSAEARLNIQREAAKAEVLIAQEAQRKITEEKLKAVEKQVAEEKAIRDKALRERVDAEKNIPKLLQENVANTLKNNVLLRDRVQNLRPGVGQSEEEAQAAFALRNTLLRQIEELDNRAKAITTKFANKEQVSQGEIQQLATLQQSITANLTKLQQLKLVEKGFIGTSPVARDKNGQLVNKPENPLETPKAFTDQLKALTTQTTELLKNFAVIAKAEKDLNAARAAEVQSREVQKKLAEALAKFTTFDVGNIVAQQIQLNNGLTEIEARLREIVSELRNNVGGGGVGPPRAAGGLVGTDRMFTPTTSGETIMNRIATRQYQPILNAMNRSRPGSSTNNNNSMSFGDIHITTSKSTTSGQLTEIASGLKRMARKGTF